MGSISHKALHRDYVLYDMDYFNGSQVAIYIGDIFVDEITGMAFQVQQTKTPIYGYASQTFDAVAPGNLIIQGEFSINFKESAYLYVVLARAKELQRLGGLIGDQFAGPPTASDDIVRDIFSKEHGTSKRTLDLLDAEKNISLDSRYRSWQRIAAESFLRGQAGNKKQGILSSRALTPRDGNFETVAEDYEDEVWGKKNAELVLSDRRADDNRFDGFDIVITYGDYSDNHLNHTVRKLTGVHIVSSAQTITTDNGTAIQEMYSFIAKDMF